MQLEKAKNLREHWGDKPCAHPSTEKEYYLGSDTGDKVCSTCGKVVDDVSEERLASVRELTLQNLIQPVAHPAFVKLFTKYLKDVEKNKSAFISHNGDHQNHTIEEIFSTYWSLEATSSTIESERIRMTRKDQYTTLPEKLKALIQ